MVGVFVGVAVEVAVAVTDGVGVGVGLKVVVGPGTKDDQKLLSFIHITASGILVIPACLVIA